jgi:hypothetical protein
MILKDNSMSKPRWLGALVISTLISTSALSSAAQAHFIIDQNPDGAQFFIDGANKDVSSFSGHVGNNNVGPIVNVSTTQNVDTGSGFANITPVKDTTLSDLIFTPANPNLFGDFSFRGQLLAAGNITLIVQDRILTVSALSPRQAAARPSSRLRSATPASRR